MHIVSCPRFSSGIASTSSAGVNIFSHLKAGLSFAQDQDSWHTKIFKMLALVIFFSRVLFCNGAFDKKNVGRFYESFLSVLPGRR